MSREPDLDQLTGRDRGFWRGRWFSFRMAGHGVAYTLRTQPNAWIEVAALSAVILTGWWLQLAAGEWAVLGLTFFLILALESVNTAIEAVVDLVSPQYHPLARCQGYRCWRHGFRGLRQCFCRGGYLRSALAGTAVGAGWLTAGLGLPDATAATHVRAGRLRLVR